jgi:hypothetical protein
LRQILNGILTEFHTEDFDLSRIQMGVTTWKGLEMFDKFLTLKDAMGGCTASCFVPFVTYSELLVIYHNRVSLDGGLFYKRLKAIKKKETFLITSSMFGRYKESLLSGFKKPKCSYYQMYLNGYHDARKHHTLFESHFVPKDYPVVPKDYPFIPKDPHVVPKDPHVVPKDYPFIPKEGSGS